MTQDWTFNNNIKENVLNNEEPITLQDEHSVDYLEFADEKGVGEKMNKEIRMSQSQQGEKK